ncbi:ATP-grasp domain-containing protein [Rhizobium anhuiense]|uniref:ATP-grasp domain-containing protein n=1 Tax=Rhizobium anhuiense TaxID=1184720 RepID=UPI0019CF3228|nr:ATP-grasp domain-containing protein [Rhizobium anhuiense]GGE00153.1 carbamoyl phosphate synthase [Rhizobium anhuiense]
MPLRVLLTSASRKAPLLLALKEAVCRIDPKAEVIAGDVDPESPSRYIADHFWAMPRTEEAYIDSLLEGCIARGIRAILPSRDGELLFWSRHKARFAEAGVAVIVSAPDAISRCVDKLAFAESGSSLGLPVIPAAPTPNPFGTSRLVVKERYGAGSIGLGLDLDVRAARAHAASLSCPIFQPFAKGPEISIDAWLNRSGHVHGLVLRRRDRVLNGESHVTTTFRAIELETLATSALEALGLSGPVVMQAIVADGGLAIIETNPRFGGASTTSIAVGLDLLFWSILEAVMPESILPAFVRDSREVRQVRFPRDILIYDPDL